jgi:hypothetical protein
MWSGDLARADRIHRYPAKMALGLAKYFMDEIAAPRFSAGAADKVRFFDPCCGSGTTILVAKAAGFSVSGMDLLPPSTVVAQAKTTRLSATDLVRLRGQLTENPLSYARRPLWTWPTSGKWFAPRTLRALQDIACSIGTLDGEPFYPHLWTALSQTCWDVSGADPSVIVPTHSNRRRGTRQFKAATVLRSYRGRLRRVIGAQEALGRLGVSYEPSVVSAGDALHSPNWPERTELVLCSPPYGTGIDYVRAVSLQGHALSEDFATGPLRARLIGRRRASGQDETVLPEEFRSQPWVVGAVESPEADADALFQYFSDLRRLLETAKAHLGTGGVLGVVLGDPEVARLRVPLTEIARAYSEELGLSEVEPPTRDRIRRRFQAAPRRSSNAPISVETLLCLTPN